MNIKTAVRLLLSLSLALAGGGCATHALWTAAQLDNSNLPARNVNLRLFAAPSDSALVVVYDEYSERHDSTGTRAYLLEESQSRIKLSRPPIFVKTNSFAGLNAIPVFFSTNAAAVPPVFAVYSTNSQSFTLSSNGKVTGPYALPVYDDGKGNAERIVLTPLAAMADLTIVGGFLGYYYLSGRYVP